jgi:alpha-L-rhamnosidase
MTIKNAIIFTFICLSGTLSHAQNINTDLLNKPWRAQWITGAADKELSSWNIAADPSLKEYGVYKFRKSFELTTKPASFVVHVSGDNRYKLYVNQQLVSLGPARGDLYFWNFETVDIAPYLQAGKNTVAALVFNEGKLKPEAQISYLTGFILQGNTDLESIVNTNNLWKVAKDDSHQPFRSAIPGYYVAGPNEMVTMAKNLKNWESINYDDSSWKNARNITAGFPKVASVDGRGWMLVPSPIPAMEMTYQRLMATRKAIGVVIPSSFPAQKSSFVVAANTQTQIVLDQSFLTNAYPTLVFSKGKDAGIGLGYAEGLYVYKGEKIDGAWVPTLPKGNRNEIDNKIFLGRKDSLISDGTNNQTFTSLTFRTYRYIVLTITTKDEALTIDDLYGTFTGYPFKNTTTFESGIAEHQKILDIGWRTARLCAFETYMDCPYYEQLQYIGDARIQALVTMYCTDDSKMVRNALDLMDHSRIAEGITLSRYPTDLHQQIPTFSLWWVQMLHDYWRYRPDTDFVKEKLNGSRMVLSWFMKYQTANGSLKNVPYWTFTDWVNKNNQDQGWPRGMAPKGKNGESSVLDLQLMWTYLVAADMEEKIGLLDFAKLYRVRAAQLKTTIEAKYWDSSRKLYADTESKDKFSQHANILAILSGQINGQAATDLAKKIQIEPNLAPASIYFKYYLHQALAKAGLGNDYMDWLSIWQQNIKSGLTTWAEISEIDVSRSDCHAWGSSPNIEFFRVVLGIDSDGAGFSKVKIEPRLGKLTTVSGSMPHPNGAIAVTYSQSPKNWRAEITLPSKTTGKFVWKNKIYVLKSGENIFVL